MKLNSLPFTQPMRVLPNDFHLASVTLYVIHTARRLTESPVHYEPGCPDADQGPVLTAPALSPRTLYALQAN